MDSVPSVAGHATVRAASSAVGGMQLLESATQAEMQK